MTDSVRELISAARENGVQAHIIESGPFDVTLSKIWRQLPGKPEHLDVKVRTAKALPVSIELPPAGTKYPILRTNALAITDWPRQCASVDYVASMTFRELKDKVWKHQPDAILSYTDQILFWGDPNEIYKILDKEKIKAIKDYEFDDSIGSLMQSGIIKSFFEEAVARSLCHEKPLLLRRKNRTYYTVVNHEEANNPLLQALKEAVGYKGKPWDITGSVPGMKKVFWAEALSIKLEEKNGSLWLLIRPDIWITPLSERENATEFLYNKKIRRYNKQSYELLDAWIRVLFGFIGTGQEVQISCFADSEYSPTFSVNTRTAFSRR